MFNLFKSRPPIIIINEAEHPAPAPIIKEKSWWSKYKGVVFSTAILFHFAAVAVIVNIIISIKENAVYTNASMLRQLHISDSLVNTANSLHYNDSIVAAQHFYIADSINAAAFKALSVQLKEVSNQNVLQEKRYREILFTSKPEAVK